MKQAFFLAILITPFLSCASVCDSSATRNLFLVSINYPFPASGVTFQTVYTGVLNISGGFERIVDKKYSIGVSADYSWFQTSNQVLDIKTKMNIICPSLTLGFEKVVFEKMFIHPFISTGYSFISFNGTDTEGNSKPEFREHGASIQPSLFVGYLLINKISIGLNGSYKIIFQHFGSNSTFEDSNIRIANFGIGVTYKL